MSPRWRKGVSGHSHGDKDHFRVAIASSGLGHVARGMEAWAEALGRELARRDVDVTLFRGAGPKKNDYDVVLPCIKRSGRLARMGRLLNHVGGWRLGLGSEAQVESFTYGMRLLWHLRRGYDIVHVQQGILALFLERAGKLGLLKSHIVFGNGQKAPAHFLSRFPSVQFLTPYDMEETVKHVPRQPGWRVITNFVDMKVFARGDRSAARKKLGLPEDRLTIVSVGMIDKDVKQMDYFVREVGQFAASTSLPVNVVIAGSSQPDSAEIEALGRDLLGDSLSVFHDLPREKMTTLYHSADVFVLCSPREACPVALIEAVSCGLPAICHSFPVMEWVIGDGGVTIDMTQPGKLAAALATYAVNPVWRRSCGESAFSRARTLFSQDVVVPQIIEMYRDIVASNCGGPSS